MKSFIIFVLDKKTNKLEKVQIFHRTNLLQSNIFRTIGGKTLPMNTRS